MDWFFITLICAFSLASADAFSKRYLADYSGQALLMVRIVIPAILLLPMLWFFPIPDAPLAFWGWIALLMPLELIALLLYSMAVRDAPLSQSVPYLAFTPVFAMLFGWMVLDESVSVNGGVGVLLIVVGAYVLNINVLRVHGRLRWFEPLRAIAHQQGARRMLIVAVIYGVTSVLGKAAMEYAGPQGFGAFYYILLAGFTLLVVAIQQPAAIKVLARPSAAQWLVGGMMAIMIVTHFMALALVEVAYMIAVKRLSLLFGILYGAWLFHEHGLSRNLLAGSIMVCGVALILVR